MNIHIQGSKILKLSKTCKKYHKQSLFFKKKVPEFTTTTDFFECPVFLSILTFFRIITVWQEITTTTELFKCPVFFQFQRLSGLLKLGFKKNLHPWPHNILRPWLQVTMHPWFQIFSIHGCSTPHLMVKKSEWFPEGLGFFVWFKILHGLHLILDGFYMIVYGFRVI